MISQEKEHAQVNEVDYICLMSKVDKSGVKITLKLGILSEESQRETPAFYFIIFIIIYS